MFSLQGFNAANVDPNFGGAGFFPVSDEKGWLVIITGDEGLKPTQNNQGNFLVVNLKGQEGPVAGFEAVIRLNLQHQSPAAMAAAQAQLSAICHVTGNLTPNSIADLCNKPFRVVSELQDKTKPEGYTQLANNGIRDVNGNKPGKGGGGQNNGGNSAPAMTGQQGGQNNGGQNGGFNQGQGQGQGNQGGGFNAGGQGNQGQGQGQGGQQGNQGQQGNGQGQNGGWGAQTGGNQGGNGNGGGWGNQGGNQGGQPGWAS